MKIGLVVHSGRHESVTAATETARRLEALGADVVAAADGGTSGFADIAVVDQESFAAGLDLAVSLGGDGTFLRAAHLCRDAGVPVLGVNLGRLGFLAEIERDELHAALASVSRGEYEVQDRPTLEVRVIAPDGVRLADGWALNEVSVEKTARQRLLLMDVHVGDSLFAKVPADALVVATPTGSTAYAFSAGGPILSPSVRATLVTPVAPHSLFDRTLVVASDEVVRVQILDDQEPAVVSADGRPPTTVPAGGTIEVVGDGHPVRVARVGPRDFYSVVRTKFGLR